MRTALASPASGGAGSARGEDSIGDTSDDVEHGGHLAGLKARRREWLAFALPHAFDRELLTVLKHLALHVGAPDGHPGHWLV